MTLSARYHTLTTRAAKRVCPVTFGPAINAAVDDLALLYAFTGEHLEDLTRLVARGRQVSRHQLKRAWCACEFVRTGDPDGSRKRLREMFVVDERAPLIAKEGIT